MIAAANICIRTLIDLKDEGVAALDAQAKREGVSRAALICQAIADFPGRIGSPDENAGFGAWKRDAQPALDGRAFEEKLRGNGEGACRYERADRLSGWSGSRTQGVSRFLLVALGQPVAERAVGLRQAHRIRLPDAITGVSAQIEGRLRVTRNSKDLDLSDPGVRMACQV